LSLLLFLSMIRRRPTSPLFPYTTLFRSLLSGPDDRLRPYRLAVGERVDRARLQAPERLPRHVRVRAEVLAARNGALPRLPSRPRDRKSTRLNSSHVAISYAGFCLKKKKQPSQAPLSAPRIAGAAEEKNHFD